MILGAIVHFFKTVIGGVIKVTAWLLAALSLWVPLLYSVVFFVALGFTDYTFAAVKTGYFLGLVLSVVISFVISSFIYERKRAKKLESREGITAPKEKQQGAFFKKRSKREATEAGNQAYPNSGTPYGQPIMGNQPQNMGEQFYANNSGHSPLYSNMPNASYAQSGYNSQHGQGGSLYSNMANASYAQSGYNNQNGQGGSLYNNGSLQNNNVNMQNNNANMQNNNANMQNNNANMQNNNGNLQSNNGNMQGGSTYYGEQEHQYGDSPAAYNAAMNKLFNKGDATYNKAYEGVSGGVSADETIASFDNYVHPEAGFFKGSNYTKDNSPVSDSFDKGFASYNDSTSFGNSSSGFGKNSASFDNDSSSFGNCSSSFGKNSAFFNKDSGSFDDAFGKDGYVKDFDKDYNNDFGGSFDKTFGGGGDYRVFATRSDPTVMIYEYSDRLEYYKKTRQGLIFIKSKYK